MNHWLVLALLALAACSGAIKQPPKCLEWQSPLQCEKTFGHGERKSWLPDWGDWIYE